jgi:hypothetical protein
MDRLADVAPASRSPRLEPALVSASAGERRRCTEVVPSREPAMEFATIPDTSLNVSRVTLGTWAIGGASWPKVPTKTNVALFSFAHDFMPRSLGFKFRGRNSDPRWCCCASPSRHEGAGLKSLLLDRPGDSLGPFLLPGVPGAVMVEWTRQPRRWWNGPGRAAAVWVELTRQVGENGPGSGGSG